MIVDCCIFSQNQDQLETRLDLFAPYVDKFLIFLESEVDAELIDRLSQYNLDVDLIIMDEFRNFEEIKTNIINLNLSYEDIVIISEENEFIDFNQIEDIRHRLLFSPVIIHHKKFIDDGVLINFERQKGSMAFFYHQIKFQDNIIEKTYVEKFLDYYKVSLPVESGFLS